MSSQRLLTNRDAMLCCQRARLCDIDTKFSMPCCDRGTTPRQAVLLLWRAQMDKFVYQPRRPAHALVNFDLMAQGARPSRSRTLIVGQHAYHWTTEEVWLQQSSVSFPQTVNESLGLYRTKRQSAL